MTQRLIHLPADCVEAHRLQMAMGRSLGATGGEQVFEAPSERTKAVKLPSERPPMGLSASPQAPIRLPAPAPYLRLSVLPENDLTEAQQAVSDESLRGFVHSQQVGSYLDGPGLRLVYWLSGCAMRCVYCHNPDTWKRRQGEQKSVAEIRQELARFARVLSIGNGGMTLSGGEPLVQTEFARALFQVARELGVHTSLDTNGYLGHRLSDEDLENIDIVLLDLKAYSDDVHRQVTGVGVSPVRNFARRLARLQRRMWVRFVLVPGWTDAPEEVEKLAYFCAALGNVERVEVLPFHQMGRYKWKSLGRNYELYDVEPPSNEEVESAREIFRAAGLNCPRA